MSHALSPGLSCGAWPPVLTAHERPKMLLAWSMVSRGVDGLEVNKLGGQVLNTWWDPAMLGTEGVRLLSLTAGYPGRLEFGLVKCEAVKCLLSAEVVHRPGPRELK